MAQIILIRSQRWPHTSSQSIEKVWKVVETKIEIGDPENPTVAEEVLLQNNDIDLSAIHDAVDERTFEQIKNIEMAHEAWKKLEESFEGTQAVKGAKVYILKDLKALQDLPRSQDEGGWECARNVP